MKLNTFLSHFKDELWPSTSEEDEEQEEASISTHCKPVWNLTFFVILWQAVYHTSNAAVMSLLSFMKYFTLFVGNAFGCQPLIKISSEIPLAYPKLRKLLGMADGFIEYVVCPKCNSVYEYQDCVIVRNGLKETKLCHHIAFPSHPQRSRRKSCNSPLLMKVKNSRGYSLVPISVYPYCPLQNSLERLVSKPGFLQSCEQWRQRKDCVPTSLLGDIYDGEIWKDFCSEDKRNFLSSPHCYLLTLNIDWFQPFTHSIYSVGGIYLTIQNLPRDKRFKEENIILVGIIPGPKEPHFNVNSYLSPLVEELRTAWETGLLVHCSPQGFPVTVRLALTCVACDIPATRKVCGFMSHNAAINV